MKISCEEAAIICNKSQYEEASFWEIVKLKFHILYCKTCAAFTKKNTTLTGLCEQANMKMLSDSEKEKMKQELQKGS
ncbi:MAG: hypothetical protein HRT65_01395 [Flavobacteriaceae bacterium]|nr:hypothetical protein [Flavobacteriaceae bacterium]